jgi:GT2 family glycosyltransferase
MPKLSIVILCWNDQAVIHDAIRSIYDTTKALDFEIIVSDNGSEEGCVEGIRKAFPYPNLRVVENKANLGFARGNNAGIAMAQGEYVLILNPDTIVHEAALDKLSGSPIDIGEVPLDAEFFTRMAGINRPPW